MKSFNFMKIVSVATYLPIIPVRSRTGGASIGWASLKGMGTAMIGLVVIGLMLYFWFLKDWCQQHPIVTKVILGILITWVVLFIIQWTRSFSEDPLLRAEPYRRINLDEKDLTQVNPINEPGSRKIEKDETRS